MASLNKEIIINNKNVRLTNLDKIYFPEAGYTKYDILKYYIDISPYLLPFLENRLCSLRRFPDGIKGKSFYQKNTPATAPSWLTTYPHQDYHDKTTNYLLINNLETLIYVINAGGFEIHPEHSKIKNIRRPDLLVIDLDPSKNTSFKTVLEVARVIKEVLDYFDIASYPKTSGSSGLHIYISLEPSHDHNTVKEMAHSICKRVNAEIPAQTTLERLIKKRGDRVYLDYLQNGLGKTLVAPYVVRPLPEAPVSTPLTWSEVLRGGFEPNSFKLLNIRERLKEDKALFLSHKNKLGEKLIARIG